MGHRLSKSYWSSSNSSSNTNSNKKENGISCVESQKAASTRQPAASNTYSAESSKLNNAGYHFQTATVTVPTQNSTQSVIIKIQLSKMEPDAPLPFATMELPANPSLLLSPMGVDQEATTSTSRLNDLSRPDNHDQNFNITAMPTHPQPVLNVTVTNRVACNNPIMGNQLTEDIKLSNLNSQMQSTMSSNNISNSNLCNDFNRISLRSDDIDNASFALNNNSVTSQVPSISKAMANDENRRTNASIFSDISNNNDVRSHDQPISNIIISSTENNIKSMDTCQHRLGSAISQQASRSIFGGENTSVSNLMGEGSSVKHVPCCQHKNYPLASKWAFCECAYREGVKNFGQFTLNLDNSSEELTQEQSTSQEKPIIQEQQPPQEAQILSDINMQTVSSPQMVAGPPCVILLSVNHPTSPQFVVGPIEDCDERARRQRALEIEQGIETTSDFLPQHQQLLSHLQTSHISPSLNFPQSNILPEIGPAIAAAIAGSNAWHMHAWHGMNSPLAGLPNFGPKVHSQMDFIHCLVPDLDKITNSSFYWGKMDRYEAESLLEGKPEGTFLLRDSAQEEYLFSVTFRKYGRSLHARIEQFNHKFSFDCHDPCVYTAPTVTGLLEHYKDPSCVMFFEPCLTIPLHRNFTFSLQQLCRASIVSRISYDGIKELHLPNSLKSYLREYHYKLRVRVKPVDEMFYSCS